VARSRADGCGRPATALRQARLNAPARKKSRRALNARALRTISRQRRAEARGLSTVNRTPARVHTPRAMRRRFGGAGRLARVIAVCRSRVRSPPRSQERVAQWESARRACPFPVQHHARSPKPTAHAPCGGAGRLDEVIAKSAPGSPTAECGHRAALLVQRHARVPSWRAAAVSHAVVHDLRRAGRLHRLIVCTTKGRGFESRQVRFHRPVAQR